MYQLTKGKNTKLFFIGSVWNIFFATCGLLMPKLMGKLIFGLRSVITGQAALGLKLTWALVFTYGIGYCIVSRDPERNRGIVWMGIIGKLSFFFITLQFYFRKTVTLLSVILTFGDFVFAALFARFLVKTMDENRIAVRQAV